ncbi:MAG: EAL domain-containing protein [Thermoanaerobaculia bacterium]|jgi:EAL domain-containing protein (putative c-di-GMP-specific phosphodiesterase class I)
MSGPRSSAQDADAIAGAASGLASLQTTLEQSADGVALFAPDSSGALTVSFANATLCRLFSRAPSELVGAPVDALGLREDGAKNDAVRERLAAGQRMVGTGSLLRADGVRKSVELSIVPVRGEGGEVSQWVAVFRDPRELDASSKDAAAIELAERADELREAMIWDHLVNYYQPIVDLKTGLVTHAEVLVRWNHPTRGLIGPDKFLPLAEATGLIRDVTMWCFEDSFRQHKEWHKAGLNVGLAMNLSPSNLRDTSIAETIAETIDKFGIDPGMIRVEITENAILDDPTHVLAILSLLQSFGVSLSLDDFGTGYSSLTNLREVPFQEIKIDKSFVLHMMEEEGDQAVVRAVIGLAHNLGRHVVAEGIEDKRTLDQLRDWDCDYAQGYYISRPIPPEPFEKWARANLAGKR